MKWVDQIITRVPNGSNVLETFLLNKEVYDLIRAVQIMEVALIRVATEVHCDGLPHKQTTDIATEALIAVRRIRKSNEA